MLKQRVVVNVHLVEANVGFASIEPKRRRGGDEVHLVAAGGKFNAKLGGDNSAAAIGRVAGDADLASWGHEALDVQG